MGETGFARKRDGSRMSEGRRMATKKTESSQLQEARAPRRRYHSPCLTECGSVGDLTQTTNNINPSSDQPTYGFTYISSTP
jgi:hypothetical protein